MSGSSFGWYTHAIVCRVSEALCCHAGVDVELARQQHELYVRELRQLQLDVIELAADSAHAQCALVEDCAVVCNGIALLCRPSDESRRGEVNAIRAVIKKELELPIVEIPDQNALLNGGDVLFTGREFFVGISPPSPKSKPTSKSSSSAAPAEAALVGTNEAGAAAVAAAFPEYPCTPIMVPAGAARLKSLVTMLGTDIMCVSRADTAQLVLKRIEREATFRYCTLTVPDAAAANCLLVNGVILHRCADELPDSCKVLEERLAMSRCAVSFSQLARAGASLTGCCILVRKSRRIVEL